VVQAAREGTSGEQVTEGTKRADRKGGKMKNRAQDHNTPQSQGYQSTSSGESTDNLSATQSSIDNVDSNMALNWVSINTNYHKR